MTCEACGVQPNEEMARTIARLLVSLDEARTSLMSALYGFMPALLCESCFLAVLGVVNRQSASQRAAIPQSVGE